MHGMHAHPNVCPLSQHMLASVVADHYGVLLGLTEGPLTLHPCLLLLFPVFSSLYSGLLQEIYLCPELRSLFHEVPLASR